MFSTYLGLICRSSSISWEIDSKSIMPTGSILPLIASTVKFVAAFPPTMLYLENISSRKNEKSNNDKLCRLEKITL